MPKDSSSNFDIFNMLSENEEEPQTQSKKKQREELLAPTHVKDLFQEGNININKHTCVGVQCKLCIKVCPTNALFWKAGEVGIIPDLCVYCGACVLACMVDDCIKVTRKREDGTVEKFSKPRDVIVLENSINTKKRYQRIHDITSPHEKTT